MIFLTVLFSSLMYGENVSASGYPRNIDRLKVGETVYFQVEVKKVTPKYILILHANGLSQVKLSDLSEIWQKRFGYNRQKELEFENKRLMERDAAIQQKKPEKKNSIKSEQKVSRNISAMRMTHPLNWPSTPVKILDSIDLRPRFHQLKLGMKDQNRRSTCTIFSMVMAYEYELAVKQKKGVELSEEFLVWAVRKYDQPEGGFGTGFNLYQVAQRIVKTGLPDNEAYRDSIDGDFSLPPPPEIVAQAARRAGSRVRWLTPKKDPELLFNQAIHALNAGHPVVMGLKWPHSKTLRNTALLDKQIPVTRHAVTLVGYSSESGKSESVRFIFKNSWGRTWGLNGCGFMSREYFLKNVDLGLTFDLN